MVGSWSKGAPGASALLVVPPALVMTVVQAARRFCHWEAVRTPSRRSQSAASSAEERCSISRGPALPRLARYNLLRRRGRISAMLRWVTRPCARLPLLVAPGTQARGALRQQRGSGWPPVPPQKRWRGIPRQALRISPRPGSVKLPSSMMLILQPPSKGGWIRLRMHNTALPVVAAPPLVELPDPDDMPFLEVPAAAEAAPLRVALAGLRCLKCLAATAGIVYGAVLANGTGFQGG